MRLYIVHHRSSSYIIVHRKSTVENSEWDVCYFRRLQQELVACKVHELANRGVTLTSLLNFWRKLEQVVCNLFLDVFSARTCWHVVSFHQLSALSISLHCLWSMWIATSAGDAELRSTSLNNQRRGAIGSSLLNVVELGTVRGDTARTHSITM